MENKVRRVLFTPKENLTKILWCTDKGRVTCKSELYDKQSSCNKNSSCDKHLGGENISVTNKVYAKKKSCEQRRQAALK